MELQGAVVVVTGASAGIGESTAIAFARRGARVVLAARRTELLDDLAGRIEAAGGHALAVGCDVSDPHALRTLKGVVEEAWGPAHAVINNAGIPGGGAFARLEIEQIRRIIEVNVLGVMYGTRTFLPGMLERGHGHIVNVASLAGRFAIPGAAVYSASKHAVVAFSEALNYETESRTVYVTAVNPGLTATEGFPNASAPTWLMVRRERVADAIVKVVRDGIAPEYSVPRWFSPLQTFRVLTPPVYRWGVRSVRKAGYRSTHASP